MPAKLLSRAGFFGKMPATGDFVARGVPQPLRQQLDAWIGAEVLPVIGCMTWPDGGLRFVTAGAALAGLVLPSRDRVGRAFPLTVVAPLDPLTGQQACNAWADAVLPLAEAAVQGQSDPTRMENHLADLPLPSPDGDTLAGPCFWFSRSQPAAGVADAFDIATTDPISE